MASSWRIPHVFAPLLEIPQVDIPHRPTPVRRNSCEVALSLDFNRNLNIWADLIKLPSIRFYE
jgi:hypothetical protein